jgi:hypothetical protein
LRNHISPRRHYFLAGKKFRRHAQNLSPPLRAKREILFT